MARALGFRSIEDKGRLLENLVYIELRRRGGKIYFHKEQKECDFLVRKQGKICEAYQVCLNLDSSATRERELQGLLEAMQFHNINSGKILTESDEEHIKMEMNGFNASITILPFWKWALDSV